MFIETHELTKQIEGQDLKAVKLTFLKSLAVKAYPCGRRRSTFIEHDVNADSVISDSERFQFPFDPEARLNTEANNRKHSGLNGYTQTYLVSDWSTSTSTTDELTLALSGYLFNIKFDSAISENAFVDGIISILEDDSANYIYANILIEDIKLFSSTFREYYTSVLRDQTVKSSELGFLDNTPSEVLDLLKSGDVNAKDVNNYYFSGLSFSTTPLTCLINDNTSEKTRSTAYNNIEYTSSGETANQLLVSLRILEKVDGNWKIHEPARLPFIEHGTTANSIVVGDTLVERTEDTAGNVINPGNLTVEGNIEVGKLDDEDKLIEGTGDIIAKNDITAEKNILAKKNLRVKNNAYIDGALDVDGAVTVEGTTTINNNADIKENLTVGDTEDGGTVKSGTGTITAKTLVEAPLVEAPTIRAVVENEKTGQITADNITVNKNFVTDALTAREATVSGTLTVHNDTEAGAQATIDNANINSAVVGSAVVGSADITTLSVQGQESSATIDNLIVPYGNTDDSDTTITNEGIATQKIVAAEAEITALTVQGTDAVATIKTELHIKSGNYDKINDSTAAKAYIDIANILYADVEATNIDKAEITKLTVTGKHENNQEATLYDATVTNDLKVQHELRVENDSRNACINADKIAVLYGDYAEGSSGPFKYAYIDKQGLNTPKATIGKQGITSDGDITAPYFYQTVSKTVNGTSTSVDMQVPIIELDEKTEGGKTHYQLKISRIGKKPTT